MNNLDDWLAKAANATRADASAGTDALLARLAQEPPPAKWAGRRELRRAVTCVALSAVLTCGGVGSAFLVTQSNPRPTWVAAPSAMSPYALLVER